MQMVMQRTLNLFWHICRMKDDRLVKIIMFGRMDGKSASERPNIESVAR